MRLRCLCLWLLASRTPPPPQQQQLLAAEAITGTAHTHTLHRSEQPSLRSDRTIFRSSTHSLTDSPVLQAREYGGSAGAAQLSGACPSLQHLRGTATDTHLSSSRALEPHAHTGPSHTCSASRVRTRTRTRTLVSRRLAPSSFSMPFPFPQTSCPLFAAISSDL